MSHVEDHAALAALDHSRIHVSGYIEFVAQSGIAVRVDIARPQLLFEQVGERPLRLIRAEIHHHGNIRERSRFHRVLDRSPFRPGVMRGLDADDQPWILLCHIRRGLRLHIGEIVFIFRTAHARAHDIQERQHARLRAIDHVLFEIFEILVARAAGIRHRRHADSKREAVGENAVVAGIRMRLAGARVHVHVNVDQSGRDVKPLDADRLQRGRRIDVLRDRRDLAVLESPHREPR